MSQVAFSGTVAAVKDPLRSQLETRKAAKQGEAASTEEFQPAPKVPLVSQGVRSAPPRPRPPTPDDWIRSMKNDYPRGGRPRHWLTL
jgi:hypothetical protein